MAAGFLAISSHHCLVALIIIVSLSFPNRLLQSAIDTDKISIDKDTQDMLKSLDFGNVANVEVVALPANGGEFHQRRRAQA